MMESTIFGFNTIYGSIVRNYSDKLSPKLKKIYLDNL
jgi:hypothetical protein